MVTFPPSKINLGLQILSKRTDGYHNISTCFYSFPWTDVLEILPFNSLTFRQTGLAIPGNAEDNLCLKAYHILKEDFKIDTVQIHLHKNIPTGAGLGGGSSDAAHTIRLLNALFELDLSAERIMQYASRIGSDCAFFIQDRPMLGSGRGELLELANINLKGYYIVVLVPAVHVSTAEAYNGVTPHIPDSELHELIGMRIAEWRDRLVNDFEMSIFQKYPMLQQLKEKLYSNGAVYASMSGSGSSVFGIFEKEIESKNLFRDSFGWSGWL